MSSKKAAPEVYKKVKTLGEGSFGKAYLVECQSDKVGISGLYIIIELGCYQADWYHTDVGRRKEGNTWWS